MRDTDRLSDFAISILEELFGTAHVPEITPEFLEDFARTIRRDAMRAGAKDPEEDFAVADELDRAAEKLRAERPN